MSLCSKISVNHVPAFQSEIPGSRILLFCFAAIAGFSPAVEAQSIPTAAPMGRLWAQTAPNSPIPRPQDLRPPAPPPMLPVPQAPVAPQVPPLQLPSDPTGAATDDLIPGSIPGTIVVKRFNVIGSTIFSPQELAAVTEPFTNRPITFAELLKVQAAITKLYTDRGYMTSGAVTPPQTLEEDVVVIQVVEGELEGIQITGTQRLNPNYVRSRVALVAQKPLNVRQLLESLQLLQLNPLIKNISAELSAGSRTGSNLLEVRVTEAKTFSAQIGVDNNQVPPVGSLRGSAKITEANLLGQGDALQVGYSYTRGSNDITFSYTLPVNPRNGAISLNFEPYFSRIIEEPFEPLDIKSRSFNLSLSFRQPIIETPTRLLALGVSAYRYESETSLLGVPLQLSPGADSQGRTRISAVSFFQEWVERGSQFAFAARSELNIGLGAFNAVINSSPPDSRFVLWRGQLQWVKSFTPDTLIVLRSDVQLADRPLLPFEQFVLGGQYSVRGYPQDLFLTDNGLFGSAELRLPVLRLRQVQGLLQVVSFIDVGNGWNSSGRANPDPNLLVSVGLGLRWQQGNALTFQLDWGIPLVPVDYSRNTLQENGLTFSLNYNLL